jgi:hypothetical protein
MEDALLLARAQFGLNIGFHILFPTISIALGWLLNKSPWQPRPVVDALQAELEELERRELIRPAKVSSVAGQTEYAFWHAVVRDVAYAQIPRAARAARHRAAAAWIEHKAGARAEDLADVLAHHFLQALELARAAGVRVIATTRSEAKGRRLTELGRRRVHPDSLAVDPERLGNPPAAVQRLHDAERTGLRVVGGLADRLHGRDRNSPQALEPDRGRLALEARRDGAVYTGGERLSGEVDTATEVGEVL